MMNKKIFLKKGLVIGIIILFIGVSVVSDASVSIKDENDQKTDNDSSSLRSLISITLPEIPKNIDESRKIIKEYVDLNYENITTYGFTTLGPSASTISKITFQNGTFQNKSLFWLNLMFTIEFRLAFFMFPLTRPIGFLVFDKIDFTVEYIKDMPQGLFSRGRYLTYILEMVNGNITNNTIEIFNEMHTVKVEGFNGALIFLKRSVRMPPSFMIVGVCDNVTLIQ